MGSVFSKDNVDDATVGRMVVLVEFVLIGVGDRTLVGT